MAKAPATLRRNKRSAAQQSVAPPNHYVAIGASAGGLEAIEAFFTNMPADSGLAFIVIQHLSPDYKSLMVEILSKKTAMPVLPAEDGLPVLPNHVYLIQPKKNLTIFHGKLLLTEQASKKGLNLPIDIFLQSLADDQGEKSVAIILSGTGSDGMRGLRHIKECGGMVLVQDEESAKFDGMPRSAISTGLADFVLPPECMPAQLLNLAKRPVLIDVDSPTPRPSDEEGLMKVFSLLRERCKVDFTFYKPTTVTRRIERRMAINQIDELRDYVRYLVHYPAEINALYRELLIGVTSFFRDIEVFDQLASKYLPQLFHEEGSREIRFWVPGCSTGEEAYTLAILAREALEQAGISRDIKIFATDIDRDALQFAAAGLYPETIAVDVPTRLLNRYFHHRDDKFQIARTIREMVVFAQHNLIKDPPFTNINLVSCRNLLIYLQPVLQHKVMEFFNFSLKPSGLLLLGTSETTGDLADVYETLEPKLKIYHSKGRQKTFSTSAQQLVAGHSRTRDIKGQYVALRRTMRSSDEERILERLLEGLAGDYLPVAVTVNENLEVLHVLGDVSPYFRLPAGKLVNDISKMAVKELSIPLTTGVQKVLRKREELRLSNVRVHVDGAAKLVDLRIKPLPQAKHQELLVAILIVEGKKAIDTANLAENYDLSREAEEHLKELEQELQFTRENLQATIEELETANEELQATNEELLASNEELQSTNEELQSTNEELYTVNSEYQSKIIELTELHNDVENLLNSTQIGTLLLDENLVIRRFSKGVCSLFRLLESDIGRPIAHIPHVIQGVELLEMIASVQQKKQALTCEVSCQDGSTYLLRAVPYVIGPRAFSGVVLSFIDISDIKRAEATARSSEDRYQFLFENMAQGVVYQDATGAIISANRAAQNMLGLSLEQMQGRSSVDSRWRAIHPDGSDFPGAEHPSMQALRSGQPACDVLMGVFNPQRDGYVWIKICAIPMFRPGSSEPYQVFATFDEVDAVMMPRLGASANRPRSGKTPRP